MRDWSLHAGDPLSLTLGADMRLCTPDYLNDHIWELELRSGEPPSLSIRTTYGLRARNMRLFYRFAETGKIVTDPDTFYAAPRLRRFHPNFFLLEFAPIEGLEITSEYWIAGSHVIAGRLTFVNRTTFQRRIDFELCGVLTPLEGKALALVKQQMINVLAGRTGGLEPVVFMTSGPRHGAGPHPALALQLDFDPGQTRTTTWACAAEATAPDSFELARKTAAPLGRPSGRASSCWTVAIFSTSIPAIRIGMLLLHSANRAPWLCSILPVSTCPTRPMSAPGNPMAASVDPATGWTILRPGADSRPLIAISSPAFSPSQAS
jgi:hypothetical protein